MSSLPQPPTALLTAVCGERVDLLVVAPETEARLAEAAWFSPPATPNLVHAQDILDVVSAAGAHETDGGRKVIMANKNVQKVNQKKQGRTLKEKRVARRLKIAAKSAPLIPPSGH